DGEAVAYLGRIYRELWTETWSNRKELKERQRVAYESAAWLKRAISTYFHGYCLNQNNYYPGINALTWSAVLIFLAEQNGDTSDPELTEIGQALAMLKGSVHLALESQTHKTATDDYYWVLASLGELMVGVGTDPAQVTRAYRNALTAARKQTFTLESSIGQLDLLASLGFRPEFVAAGLAVLREELARIGAEQPSDAPKQVDAKTPTQKQAVMFAGHALDKPELAEACFPAAMEAEARDRIEKALEKLQADANDVGITYGAACGGDILFMEACLKRSMTVEVLLPFDEEDYLGRAVSYAGSDWLARFYNARNNPAVSIRYQVERLGPVKPGDDPLERNQRWALYRGMGYGTDKLRLIALWNGKKDEHRPGRDDQPAVAHMVQEARQAGVTVEHLNTTKFEYWNTIS
ncbi:MAG: tetratricopeptide repeat-containing protein, partial [Chloroflexota bacterium]